MTSEQLKEYICNDDDLGCLYDYMMAAMAGNDISELPRLWNQEIGVIKSRPHPAPEISHTQCYKTGYADGARQAREDVLKELLYNIDGETGFYAYPHPSATAGHGLSRFVLLDDLKALVESLRHPTTPQEHRQPRGYPITDWEAEQVSER